MYIIQSLNDVLLLLRFQVKRSSANTLNVRFAFIDISSKKLFSKEARFNIYNHRFMPRGTILCNTKAKLSLYIYMMTMMMMMMLLSSFAIKISHMWFKTILVSHCFSYNN